MKLLCLVQHFHQGWGGAPESIRLLARELAPGGVSVDVFDLGRLHRSVETLDLLPDPDAPAETFDAAALGRYDAMLVAGPWQNPVRIWPIVSRFPRVKPLAYLPRGGLAEIEFERRRDLKKWPYLHLIEKRIVKRCSAVVYSSRCERDHTVAAARNLTREVVIPDFFNAPPALPPEQPETSGPREVKFAFMAEIAPRKGLVPLVEAFVQMASRPRFSHPVRLTVGGSVRAGSEAYHDEAKNLAGRAPPHARIEFIGPVTHGDRPEFYRDADVFLVPSRFESYGLTVLEGLAAGCAEVSGPELGVLEYLPPHDRLTIARAIDPDSLADAMARQFELALASGPDDRARTSDYAAAAIVSLNDLARQHWEDILAG